MRVAVDWGRSDQPERGLRPRQPLPSAGVRSAARSWEISPHPALELSAVLRDATDQGQRSGRRPDGPAPAVSGWWRRTPRLARAEVGEHARIAGQLALGAQAGKRDPDQRIEPVNYLDRGHQPVERDIAPAHVVELVQQDETELIRAEPGEKAGRDQQPWERKSPECGRAHGRSLDQTDRRARPPPPDICAPVEAGRGQYSGVRRRSGLRSGGCFQSSRPPSAAAPSSQTRAPTKYGFHHGRVRGGTVTGQSNTRRQRSRRTVAAAASNGGRIRIVWLIAARGVGADSAQINRIPSGRT